MKSKTGKLRKRKANLLYYLVLHLICTDYFKQWIALPSAFTLKSITINIASD